MLICILTTAGLYLLSGGGVYAALCRQLIERPQTERMRNVTVEARTSAPERLAGLAEFYDFKPSELFAFFEEAENALIRWLDQQKANVLFQQKARGESEEPK